MKNFIDKLQSNGIYSFQKSEIIQSLNISPGALKKGLERYCKKGRIAKIKSGFYIIIPLEYRDKGLLPPSWFIDELMNYLKSDYYVGLASAASFYGASHQQSQIFCIMVKKQIRNINVKGLKINFIVKKNMVKDECIEKIKTETGSIRVSNPDLTVIDLIRYVKRSGGWDNAATIIAELRDKLNPSNIIKLGEKKRYSVYIKRLGYILTILNENIISSKLYDWVHGKKVCPAPLDARFSIKNTQLNKRWMLWINRHIESDIL